MQARSAPARLTARVILAVAVLAGAAGLLELGARVLGLGNAARGTRWYAGSNHPQYLFEPDADAGYRLRPGFTGIEIAATGEFRLAVAIDERGLPVRAQPQQMQGGILAVGDSMTFGEGVAADDAWPAKLERTLGVAVTNGGVPGYSSAQMSARASQLVPTVRPQLILLAFFPLWDLWRCDDPLAYRDGFIVIRSFADKLHLVNGNLYQEFLTGPHLGPWSARAIGTSAFLRSLLPHFSDRGVTARGQRRPAWSTYEPCMSAIRHAQQTATEAGAQFRVVVIENTGSPPPETTEVTRRLDAAGIPFISLDLLMGGKDESGLRYKDGHWNAAGHAAVADALAPVVRVILRRAP